MKIINVTPGLIPIPPNGWGAVEKIIWEFHNNLLALGHDSQIKYLDEVTDDADIVHIHVANLANMAHEKGIPYYFTFHDHHAYLYGKDSPVYKENLLAIKNAIKAFVPARYLVEYFDNIPEYFSHGVNTEYFYPPEYRKQHKLLCLANNGYIHNQSEDRKGFGFAIEAAKRLGLPITIAGPKNNQRYFEQHPISYDKLTVLYDLNEKEIQQLYQEHTIFVHPSELEAGHPNLTIVEALSSGLPVVGTLESATKLDGMYLIERSVDSVVSGIITVLHDYKKYTRLAREQALRLSWQNRTREMITIYENRKHPSMKEKLLHHYTHTKKLSMKPKSHLVNLHSIDGMFIEILGSSPNRYKVRFRNKTTGNDEYITEIENNCWARSAIKYYVDWDIIVEDLSTKEVFHYSLDMNNKRVYIALDSRSLGDTLAWLPYVEEFRKKHNCEMICSTFSNDLFKDQYPHITFVEPGTAVNNIVAMYMIGLFYKENGEVDIFKNPRHPITVPLQQIASDILGLDYKEVRPKLKHPTVTQEKQVSIAIHSTTQAKYWNNPFGWQEVVNYIKSKGYTVKLLSHEPDGYMGNKNPTGVIQHPAGSIDSIMEELKKSKVFIGLGSGLSWLSWALEVPTVLISGFSYKWAEMQDCIRIGAPKGKCEGCFNRHRLDAGDWNWCPDHKGTPRQFECSREITADMVIRELEKIL